MRFRLLAHERMFRVVDTQRGHARASANKSKRGAVSGISGKSRYRLIRFLATINRPDAPVFLTLTYRDFSESFTDWKRDLHAFRNALKYYFPNLAGVWRLEFQQRGAPHFHCLLWLGTEETNAENFRALCSRIWLKVIDQDTEANRRHGVTVEPVNDFRRTAFYLSVYQAKDAQDRTDILTGREWGVWRKDLLNVEPVEEIGLCADGVCLLRRVVRKAYESFCRRSGRAPGRYARGLGRNQPFSSFLPLHEAQRLAAWAAGAANDVRLCRERDAVTATADDHAIESRNRLVG